MSQLKLICQYWRQEDKMENEQPILNVEQKEYVKLIKNTKGYNWEIKVLNNDIEELKKLNDKMIEEFEN